MEPRAADDDAILDLYLDARLSGADGDPAAFLARHPNVSPEMRARIEAIHAAAKDAPAPVTAPAAPLPDGRPFERLGDFRLVRRLDEGGMGSVYLAVQGSLGR